MISVAGDLGEGGAAASQSAQRAGGEGAGEAASRDKFTRNMTKDTTDSLKTIEFPLLK